MGYEAAIKKAWDKAEDIYGRGDLSVRLLNDTYDISIKDKICRSVSKKSPAKDFLTILLLHYLISTAKNKFIPSGEWISFKEIEGGEFYYPAFREGAINPILKKFGDAPEKLLENSKRFKADKIDEGDVAIEITTFDDIKVKVILWKGDDEFGPEATILFDKNLTNIFETEDMAVFLRFIAHNL